jgi:hypothetical protein
MLKITSNHLAPLKTRDIPTLTNPHLLLSNNGFPPGTGQGFRMYWRLISRVRKQVGRRPTPKEVRELISRIVADEVFALCRSEDRIRVISLKNGLACGRAEVLANEPLH